MSLVYETENGLLFLFVNWFTGRLFEM